MEKPENFASVTERDSCAEIYFVKRGTHDYFIHYLFVCINRGHKPFFPWLPSCGYKRSACT